MIGSKRPSMPFERVVESLAVEADPTSIDPGLRLPPAAEEVPSQ